ncbi:MAG: hypothetical protein M3R24_05395, partial [Chloroflexota bacterium]|nr:hypothetical protein [Chloroflexota bacterium]
TTRVQDRQSIRHLNPLVYSHGMGKMLNLQGQRFGRLTALHPLGISHNSVVWRCLCDCGQRTRVPTNHLTSGHTTSCGCARAAHGVADEHTQKRCSTCKEWKLLQHFTPNPGKAYDHSSECKPCAAKRQTARRARKKAAATDVTPA